MKEKEKTFENEISDLHRLEKRYSCLMKQSFEAGANDRAYSDELNQKAMEIKKEIKAMRANLYVE